MELKNLMILLSIMLTVFVVIGGAYSQISENVVLEGASSLSLSNSTEYELKLDNIKDDAQENFQESKNIGTEGESDFDKLGALIESGFEVAGDSIDTAQSSTELITDVQNDTSSFIPPVIFTALIGIVFIVLLFGLIKILTGR